MNPTDDLDRRVERWMGDATPVSAPRSLVDGVLARTSSLPQRSGGRLGFSLPLKIAGAVVVLALAVAVGFGAGQLMTSGVGQATSTPSPSAPPTVVSSPSPSPTAEPSGTPSPAPTNSPAAGRGDALLTFTQVCEVAPPILLPMAVIFEDGRLIWQENGPATFQWRARQLSPSGLETVRARIAATGLLDRDGNYLPVPQVGAQPPGHGACAFTFDHQDGATDVSVTSTMWFGDEEEAAYWEPAPERHELDAFAQQLRSPEAWLGPDDWADAASAPYVSDSYVVLVSEEFGQVNGPDLEAVDWPFEAPPSQFGEPVEDSVLTGPPRCGVASRDEIERYVAGQTQPGGEPIDLAAPSTYLNVREGHTWYAVNLWSVPVPGVADCSHVI